MKSEVLTLKGTSQFDANVKALISLGALFVCASSTLATHQFLTRYWIVLFYVGCSIVVSGTALSVIRKTMKRYGYVNSDKSSSDLVHPQYFKGKYPK